MRKLIIEHWISLDGYAADLKGRTDFFPSTEENHESDEDQLRLMESVDTILLGRKTYEIFADYWPKATVDKEIMSEKLNSIPKVVISNTIKSAPWGKWAAASVKSGDALDVVKELKKESGKDIIVWGSISLCHALMKTDLVDELRVQVCPVRLGDGLPLFPKEEKDHELKFVSTKAYGTGVVLLKYSR